MSYLNTAGDCADQGIIFLPMVGEPSGGWGPSAICAFKALARAQAACSGQTRATVLAAELQHLCTVVRRANARAVLRRDNGDEMLRPAAVANAAAVLADDT